MLKEPQFPLGQPIIFGYSADGLTLDTEQAAKSRAAAREKYSEAERMTRGGRSARTRYSWRWRSAWRAAWA